MADVDVSNLAIGTDALASNTTGFGNTAIGRFSLRSNTTGHNNISIGSGSLRNNTDGTKNISIGNFALFTNTGGDFNIAIGSASLYSNTTANNNISIGTIAGYALQTGGDNTIIGYAAGFQMTSTQNTIVGSKAGGAISTGTDNIVIGYNAVNGGSFSVTGADNVVMGNASGLAMNSATRNILIGNNSGTSIQAGSYNIIVGVGSGNALINNGANVFIGDLAGQAVSGQFNTLIGANANGSSVGGNFSEQVIIGADAGGGNVSIQSSQVLIGYRSGFGLTGVRNTFLGHRTGEDASSVDDSVLIGFQAGSNITTGDNNVIIGSNAGLDATTISQTVLIGKSAGENLTTLSNNTFVGYLAGFDGTTVEDSTIVGSLAGENVTTADNNTFVGTRAGDQVTTGGTNTFVGTDTANTTTTGNNNIFVGYAAGGLVGAGVNAANGGVGPVAAGSNNIIIGVNVGVQPVVLNAQGQPAGAIAANNNQVVLGNNASLDYIKWGDAFLVPSDERDKIDTGSLGVGLNLIRDLKPKYYKWNGRHNYQTPSSPYTASFTSSRYSIGVMAQDIVALTGSYSILSNIIGSTSGSYLDGTGYEQYIFRAESLLWPTVQAVKDLDGITAKTGSNSFVGSQSISGSQFITGSLTLTRPRAANSVGLDLYGNGTRGGSQYFDFLRVTNTTGSATTPSKTFRLDGSGRIEIVNDAYNTLIFTLNDSGSLSLPGTSAGSLSGFKNTGGGLSISNGNTVIFDDGNMHIHSANPDGNMWINASGSGNVVINGQTGAAGGLLIGTSTKTGYVTINGSAAYNLGSYGYLTSAGATGTSSGTANYSLVADNRIASSEFNAYSDERLKNIIDNVSVNEATKFVLNTHPIKFTWKNSGDGGIKVGYSAQEVMKAGFDNLVGVIPNESLEEHIDDDGFVSPSGSQLTVNYEQIIPYHSVVIKHLLEKIEELQKEIQELKGK